MPERRLDEAMVRLERESFILLQHVYTVCNGVPGVRLHARTLRCGMAWSEAEWQRLITHLTGAGLLLCKGADAVVLTALGTRYIERLAGRRRSVRRTPGPITGTGAVL